LREDHFVVHMRGLPGTSLAHSLSAGRHVSAELLGVPAVRSVNQQVGRAELGEDTWGVEYSELEVDLRRSGAEDIEATDKALKEKLANVYGYSFEVLPFLSERIKETVTGSTAPVVVKVYGEDLDSIDAATQQIVQALGKIKGDGDIIGDVQTGVPEMVVRVRDTDASRFHLRRSQVLEAVHTAYQGAEVAQVYKGNRVIDLVVILDPAARQNPDQIANLWISVPAPGTGAGGADVEATPRAEAPGKGRVQLWQVADVYLSDGRYVITHEGGLRVQTVRCNVKRDVIAFGGTAEAAVKELRLPPGTRAVVTGEHQTFWTALVELIVGLVLVGIVIALLVWLALGSARRLLLVLVNVPFALVGGVAAVYLMGGNLDVGSLIGFVTLFGITMRNGIMMVSHWQHLHEVEGVEWGPELIFRGARERLAPVLMTALVTGLGLLPIAVGTGEAGREIEGPMAVVILGGLVTSTGLNLFVLPVLYRRLGG
jgi:Cu/Ag efflux pump CusA